jgi:hypothetical protein
MAKQPRQNDLPTMEDSAIKTLENAALAYVEARDERMDYSKTESERKSKVMNEMKKAGKTHYSRNGITIDLITESETVKVKVKQAKDAEAES